MRTILKVFCTTKATVKINNMKILPSTFYSYKHRKSLVTALLDLKDFTLQNRYIYVFIIIVIIRVGTHNLTNINVYKNNEIDVSKIKEK